MYSHGVEHKIDEDTRAKLLQMINNKDFIEQFIASGESVLNYYNDVEVVSVESNFLEAFQYGELYKLTYDTKIPVDS